MESGGVDLYICGHEHVFQRHKPAKPDAVQHIISGNSGADKRKGTGLYKGINQDQQVVDWYDETNTHGFVAYCVEGDIMTISFIDAVRCEAFETIVIHKRAHSTSSIHTAGASSTCAIPQKPFQQQLPSTSGSLRVVLEPAVVPSTAAAATATAAATDLMAGLGSGTGTGTGTGSSSASSL